MTPIDPALLAMLAKLEPIALGAVMLMVRDLDSGKSLQATLVDLGDTAAENLAALEDRALKAAGM